jgi:hypothetical protein
VISTSWAFWPSQRKQTRYWSFARILCRPARSPLIASSRLPGGRRDSFRVEEASSCVSFLRAVLWMEGGNSGGRRPSQSVSVGLLAKDWITGQWSNMLALRASCQTGIGTLNRNKAGRKQAGPDRRGHALVAAGRAGKMDGLVFSTAQGTIHVDAAGRVRLDFCPRPE